MFRKLKTKVAYPKRQAMLEIVPKRVVDDNGSVKIEYVREKVSDQEAILSTDDYQLSDLIAAGVDLREIPTDNLLGSNVTEDDILAELDKISLKYNKETENIE